MRKKVYCRLEYLATLAALRKLGGVMNGRRPSVLVVNRELSVTGSAMMLLAEIKVLLKNGFFVLAATSRGGGLISELDKLGVICLVSPALSQSEAMVRRLAADVDLVIVNSVVCGAWVDHLPPSAPLIWYIHEGPLIDEEIKLLPQAGRALRRRPRVYAVTDYARSFLPDQDRIRVLWPTVPDVSGLEPPPEGPGRPLRVAVVGSFVEHKGQDLVLEALGLLSPGQLSEVEFYMVGLKTGPFFNKLRENCPADWPVFFVGEVADQEAKWNLFNDFDVFCVPSRHESCSLVTLEACMLGKPVIISDQVGVRYMLREGGSGLIFTSEDAADLRRCLLWCLDHRGQLPAMGREARRAYEEKASWDQFERNLMAAVEAALAPPETEAG